MSQHGNYSWKQCEAVVPELRCQQIELIASLGVVSCTRHRQGDYFIAKAELLWSLSIKEAVWKIESSQEWPLLLLPRQGAESEPHSL